MAVAQARSGVAPEASVRWLTSPWRRALIHTSIAIVGLDREMSFIEHLDELRRRIAGPMIALYGVGIGVAWAFGKRRVAVASPE